MPKELKKRINEVQVSKRKEIEKIRAQLNEIEKKIQQRELMKQRDSSLKICIKLTNLWLRKMTQINKIRYKRVEV